MPNGSNGIWSKFGPTEDVFIDYNKTGMARIKMEQHMEG